jgi:hypothetical protein
MSKYKTAVADKPITKKTETSVVLGLLAITFLISMILHDSYLLAIQ